MRPLELTIQGFKSYRERCSFNFEGRGLFGIVGPTGAGKSSILDAMIYCLYGKTPRLERETKKLINSQADEAKLQLAFEMDGAAWQITRVVRRKGASQVLLERIDGSGDPVSGDRNVNEKLPAILGLDFGAFCSSVCLSQGQFDRFLSATASERVQILKGVFALDKVDELREAAKGASRLINDEIRVIEGILEALPGDAETGIRQAAEELVAARARVDEIREVLPRVTSALMDVENSMKQEQLLEDERRGTEDALALLPDHDVIEELVDREEAATSAAAEAEKELAAVELAAGQVERELARIEKGGRGWDWCSQVETALRSQAALAEELLSASEALKAAEAALAEAKTVLASTEKAHAEASDEFVLAAAQLREIEQRHAAHLLRGELKPGAPCPVCEQTVAEVPARPALPAMQEAEKAYSEAARLHSEAREAVELARRHEALAAERVKHVRKGADSLESKRAESEARLAELAGTGEDPRAELIRARGALEELKIKSQSANSRRQAASLAIRQATARREQVSVQKLQTVTVLSSVCGKLGVDSSLLAEEGLPQTVKKLHEHARLKLDDLHRRSAALSLSVGQAGSVVSAFRARFISGPGEAPAEVLARAISRVESIERRKEDLEAALLRRGEAETQKAGLAARKALYDRLAADLTDAKFTAYLLTEQTRLLCELASEKFRELSGYYTFDFDAQGSITVVDERTGAIRSPQDTLSGGESFLASLSLALALAETVANRGGRLECFFLDEGFGSLDAEALDRALEGIQALAEPGRMIGLISHVGGIQSQLEDLIVLERNGDGSTSVVQESGPISYLPAAI